MTGATEGTYRVAAIYRNQYRSISTPYQTGSASFDIRLLQDKLPNDIFGVGGLFVGDKSGDAKLATNSGMVSVAFHKGLDKGHKHYVGLGVQLGYTQRSIQYQNLLFPDQVDPGGTVSTRTTGDAGTIKPNSGYFDMGMGIFHQSRINDMIGVISGISLFHIVPSKEKFITPVSLSPRVTASAGLRIKASQHIYVNPNFIYQFQNKAQEANVGATVEYRFNAGKSDAAVSAGGWYRVKDAAIITLGGEYYHTRLMFAYDVNASNLQSATSGKGAFEIALIFNGFIKTSKVVYPDLVPCPMM